jgi:hypothetical protein
MRLLGKRRVIAAVLIALFGFLGSRALVSQAGPGRGGAQPARAAPKAGPQIGDILDSNARKPRFNGSVRGWRLGPYQALAAEGVADRHLSRTCEATPAGAETVTQLDFALTYIPRSLTIEDAAGPNKWVCSGQGLSVLYDYTVDTPYGVGEVLAERAIWGRRSLEVFAADDRVEQGSVNGKPAIFVHPADDSSGLGQGQIIVIEDDTPPEFTILRVSSDNGIPFAELVKIAEGAK